MFDPQTNETGTIVLREMDLIKSRSRSSLDLRKVLCVYHTCYHPGALLGAFSARAFFFVLSNSLEDFGLERPH